MGKSEYDELLTHSLFFNKDAQESFIKSMYDFGLPMTPEEILEVVELWKESK
jgi:hypothetical protein